MIKVTLQSEASSARFTFRLLQTHRERLIGLLGFVVVAKQWRLCDAAPFIPLG